MKLSSVYMANFQKIELVSLTTINWVPLKQSESWAFA